MPDVYVQSLVLGSHAVIFKSERGEIERASRPKYVRSKAQIAASNAQTNSRRGKKSEASNSERDPEVSEKHGGPDNSEKRRTASKGPGYWEAYYKARPGY